MRGWSTASMHWLHCHGLSEQGASSFLSLLPLPACFALCLMWMVFCGPDCIPKQACTALAASRTVQEASESIVDSSLSWAAAMW